MESIIKNVLYFVKAFSHQTSNVYNVKSIEFFLFVKKKVVHWYFILLNSKRRTKVVLKIRFPRRRNHKNRLHAGLTSRGTCLGFPITNHHPNRQHGATLSLGSAAVGDGGPCRFARHVRIACAFRAQKITATFIANRAKSTEEQAWARNTYANCARGSIKDVQTTVTNGEPKKQCWEGARRHDAWRRRELRRRRFDGSFRA